MKGSPSGVLGSMFDELEVEEEEKKALKGKGEKQVTQGRQAKGEADNKKEGQTQNPKTSKRIEKKPDAVTPPAETVQKGDEKKDRGLGINKDGTFKQSKAGRPAMDEAKKRIQFVLTIPKSLKSELEAAAENKQRSAANYLSEYVFLHIDDIVEYIKGQVL